MLIPAIFEGFGNVFPLRKMLENEILTLAKRKTDRKEARVSAVADMKKKHCFHLFVNMKL